RLALLGLYRGSGGQGLSAQGGVEGAGMKLEGRGQVLHEIGPVVAAGVKMEFVGNAAVCEHLVKRLRAVIEAVAILRAAIEIDLHPGEFSIPSQHERIVVIPELRLRR